MAESCRRLNICTPSGQEIELDFNTDGTIWALKQELETKNGTSAAGAILLHGDSVLEDHWTVEHAIPPASVLTLVMSSFPVGRFTYSSAGSDGPAGFNTSADVQVQIHANGKFDIAIQETEITSDDEDEDYDPYESHAAWDHEYKGTVVATESKKLSFSVSDCKCKGHFSLILPSPGTELTGTFESFSELKLELPFAAGGCNAGTAGMCWLTLVQ
ncbi:PAP7 [Symbiodinium pilosum]|uniref:PAP7 protein n=1 Tax=Symbiodinium pilosum TaxID=2952 RepID=A0A812WN08_SYMPI|nr:PAP7 [Symbiodinium pilosum]